MCADSGAKHFPENAVGVHPIACLIGVKVRGWYEGVFNPIHVRVQHFFHTVTTGKSGMDTKEEAEGGGEVHFQCVESQVKLVFH